MLICNLQSTTPVFNHSVVSSILINLNKFIKFNHRKRKIAEQYFNEVEIFNLLHIFVSFTFIKTSFKQIPFRKP